jgi:D-alanyl-D-alanine carboxypeptidase
LQRLQKFIIYSLLAFFLLINTSYARFKSLNIKSSPNYSSIVLNADTGEVIHAVNHNKKRYPASLTKMMTLYLTFDALKKNKLGFSQSITVSKRAASMPRSNIDLKKGQRITVRQAIYALIVKSANDASVVLSEGISGNEDNFVALMNKKAKELGMYDTKFQNSHGWHHDGQYTTAHDLSKLATALRRDFPGYYHLFSMKSFVYRGKEIRGHNRVLGRYKHADGLKTGYVNASGFNLATSTSKPEGKLVAIVMGGQTAKIRDDHMINLLDKGYAKLGKGKKQIRKAIVTKKNIPSKKNVFQYASIAPKKPVRYKRARSLNK